MQEKLNAWIKTIYAYAQQNKVRLVKIGAGCFAFMLCAVLALLISEYRFFRQQSAQMVELKEDYRNYVVAVKRVLSDYYKTKERLDEIETAMTEKKNEIEADQAEIGSAANGFPEGVRVFSTDDEQDEESHNFIVVNRELEYLKQATLEHVRKQKLHNLLERIGPDIWAEYSGLAPKKVTAKPRKKRVRRSRMASNRLRTADLQTAIDVGAPQDISFMWPVDRSNFWISSPFGPRRKANGAMGFHKGLDLAAVRGTPVKAAANGVVVEARYAPGYGNTIVIAHNHKYRTRYAHLHRMHVKVGQKVARGQGIGQVGSTGHVRSKPGRSGAHLHFEVYVFGKHMNPIYFLG